MYKRESLEGLRRVADPKQVISLVGGISLQDISDNGFEVRCSCPLHLGDNKTGFSWKRSSGRWTCYTKNCGGNTSKDLYAFVALKLGISWVEAAEYLARSFNYSLEQGDYEGGEDYEVFQQAVKSHQQRNKYSIASQRELAHLPGYTKYKAAVVENYLVSRNYIPSEVSGFNFYPMTDVFGILRMGIPVYDDTGKLVGINGRIMDTILSYPKEVVAEDGKKIVVPKYRMTSFDKRYILYNLQNAKQHSVKNGLIVVEGQLDVARLHTYGIYNSVCTMGTSLTPQQIALVYKYSYSLTFLLEEGEAAKRGVVSSIKQLHPGGLQVKIAKLPSGDADSNTKDVILECLRSARVYANDDIEAIKLGCLDI
jgi:DNA primase